MVFEKLKGLIRNIGITEEITPDTLLFADLAMDSTELADLSTAIMKEFGIAVKGNVLGDYSVGRIEEMILQSQKE